MASIEGPIIARHIRSVHFNGRQLSGAGTFNEKITVNFSFFEIRAFQVTAKGRGRQSRNLTNARW
jgi:hypothetical protein